MQMTLGSKSFQKCLNSHKTKKTKKYFFIAHFLITIDYPIGVPIIEKL